MNLILVNLSENLNQAIKNHFSCFGHEIFTAPDEENALLLVKVLKQEAVVVTTETTTAESVKNSSSEIMAVVLDSVVSFAEAIIEQISGLILSVALPFSLEAVERQHIQQVLSIAETYEIAADMLGINMSTLWRKRKQYAL